MGGDTASGIPKLGIEPMHRRLPHDRNDELQVDGRVLLHSSSCCSSPRHRFGCTRMHDFRMS